jgi:hypothetical protein
MDSNTLLFRAGKNFRLGAGISEASEAALCSALCDFLVSHDLAASRLGANDGSWEHFEIRVKDLTPDGVEVLKGGLDNWLRGIDRGKDPSDTGALSRALKKLRG